jgi:calmodulin
VPAVVKIAKFVPKAALIKELNPALIKTYTKSFKKFDQDEDGKIDSGDLKSVMWSLGFEVDDEKVTEIIKMVDFGNSGAISLQQFLDMMVGQLRDRKTFREYTRKFEIYDKNKDGYISE